MFDLTALRLLIFNGFRQKIGDHVEQDLYEKAAEQNDADAQFNLGLIYDKGEGVPADKQKAVELYKKAAENGNTKALFNLAVKYHKGEEGILEKDNKESIRLYQLAADKGNAKA